MEAGETIAAEFAAVAPVERETFVEGDAVLEVKGKCLVCVWAVMPLGY